MATRQKTVSQSEFISVDEAERMAQVAAGRALSMLPDYEVKESETDADPDEVALENVLSELGSSGADAKVNVYQIDEKKNRAFVGSFLPSDFSIEQIQALYGAGDYAVEVRKDKKWLKKTVIKIAAPRNVSALSGVPNPVVVNENAKIIEAMQNGFKEMSSVLANALAGLAANQPKQKTTMEMLQELHMMKEIMGVSAAPPVPDPMRLFEMATEIAEKINPRVGEPGTGEIILNAIKEFGPVLSQAAQNAARAPASVSLPHSPAVTPVQTPVQTPAQMPAQTNVVENDQMNLAKKMYLNLLISNAANDNDPSTYAQLLLDTVGEKQALEFANSPDWFEKLCAEDARAAQYKGWFEELREMVLELTKPEMPDINANGTVKDTQASDPNNVL